MTDQDGRLQAVRREMDALLRDSAICRTALPEASPPARPTAAPRAVPGRGRGLVIGALLLTGVGTGVAISGWPPRQVVAEGVRQSVGGKAPATVEASAEAQTPTELPTLDLAAIDAATAETRELEAADVDEAETVFAPQTPAARVEPRAERVVAARPRARRDDCSGYSADDAALCLYDRLLDADQRLANAYDRARVAGVPSGELRALRREWVRARGYAEDDPVGVTEAYEDMAADLRAAAGVYGSRAAL